MKIRNGFVSNSSSSSFIIKNVNNEEVAVYNKRTKEWECWTAHDILEWVKSMMKRERKRNGDEITERFLNSLENELHIDTIENVKDKLNLPYWYAGCQIGYPSNWVLYDTTDNFISYELAEKIVKKFDIGTYETHMG